MTQLKKLTAIGIVVLLLLVVHTKLTLIAKEDPDTIGMGDRIYHRKQYTMNGQWVPGLDPLKIGENNFATLQNIRYTATGLEGVLGYSQVNYTDESTYTEGKSGIHFVSPYNQNYVLFQAEEATGTTSVIMYSAVTPPTRGDPYATAIHTDAPYAGLGRFSDAPAGQVAYANGAESMIFAGSESRTAAFFTSTATITDELTNPRDYTRAIQNTLEGVNDIATIGGGNDTYTKLLMHCDGEDGGSVFTDDSDSGHTSGVTGWPQTDQDAKMFGTASLYLMGGSAVTFADSDDWSLSNDAFTFDVWFRYPYAPEVDSAYTIFSQWDDADNFFKFDLLRTGTLTKALRIIGRDAATADIDFWVGASSLKPNTWYHLAFIRGWGGTTSTLAITVDGEVRDTQTGVTASLPDLSGVAEIGCISLEGDYCMIGHLDELRLSKGVARWQENFSPMGRPYDSGELDWVVGSTRPLEGVKYYLANINETSSGGTLSVAEWDGNGWGDLTSDITDSTSGLEQNGSVSWTMTGNAKPKYLEGLYLYWYRFTLSSGAADIYHITTDKGWNSIIDLWDGVYREPISFQAYRDGVYEDYTLEVNEASNVSYPIVAQVGALGSGSAVTGDHILAMFDDRTTAMHIQMLGGSGNTLASTTATVHYWSGTTWTEVSSLVDGTASGTTSLAETGVISWSPPAEGEEFPRNLFGISGYAYIITFDSDLGSNGDEEDNSEVGIDLVYGIPAQKTITGYKFPLLFKERLFLCNSTDTKEGNRCDYSENNAPDVWNGAETSDYGQALYFGNSEELTAGTQIYNRFGSSIYNTALLFKNSQTFTLDGDGPDNWAIKTVSQNIGCPAPLTLTTAEIGYQIDKQSTRNVALWLSHQGPMLFDGAVIVPLRGIENYFDPSEDEYIELDYMEKAVGWFDSRYKEYNIIFPSGDGQSTPNKWLVYDLMQQKWFEKVPPTYPLVAFPTVDPYGTEYIYAMITGGKIYRLENGITWAGSAVTNTLKTAEILPTGNVWDRTSIRYVKLIGTRTAEDVDVTVKHYYDGYGNSNTLAVAAMDQNNSDYRFFKNTQAMSATTVDPYVNWSHQFEFSATASSTTKGLTILGWGFEYNIEREDLPVLTAGMGIDLLYFTSDLLYFTVDTLTFD